MHQRFPRIDVVVQTSGQLSDMAASIDASQLSEGTHQVELSLKLDEDHYAYQPITVSVTVKAKNTQDGDTSTDSGEDTGE